MDSIHGKLSPVSIPLGGVLTTPPLISAELMIKPSYHAYDGDYVVIPKAYDAQILPTANKVMIDDVEVLKVPYFETSNENGITVYIAREV